ncbi:DNA-binding protein [Luteolibacter algae]|uniref:DNA-binding protein n=1 Tax=Luteolibacter algae TaxID=454151 RepID=A0ABW5D701_9BACT
MAQTKIIVDSNSYFRLAQNIHPFLCTPFGKEDFTIYMHADLNVEIKCSSRIRNKFHWVSETKFANNRGRSVSLSREQKSEIADTFDFMWEYVKEEFLAGRGKGPSRVDTTIVATAMVLGIRLVTDDQDMMELAGTYGVHQITSLGLMKLMLDEKHIDDGKIDQVVGQWIYDNDTPYKDWKAEFRRLFGRKVPKGS